MHRTPRPFLTVAALAALGGLAAAMGGCASKPRQPESTAAAMPPPKPQATPPAATGVPAGEASSAAGAPADTEAPASAGTSAGTGASASAGTPAGSSGSVGAKTSAGCGASAGAAGGSAVPRDRPQTSDERRAALDKRLNDSLGSFDEQLRKERQQIARERDARQATVTTVAAADGGAKPDVNQNGDAAETSATELPHKSPDSHPGATDSRSARGGDLKSENSASGAGNASGNGAVATEIPDGSDDDVIARRLRKAAEQETDTELKDRLWKEYVEYKKNTPGK